MTDFDRSNPVAVLNDRTFTLKEFCFAESMSLATYHKLRKQNLAPREIRLPGSTLVRISAEARREWHAKMADWSDANAARIDAERSERARKASEAGKLAAASPRHHCRRFEQATAARKATGRRAG